VFLCFFLFILKFMWALLRSNKPSDKQVNYVRTLCEQRGVEFDSVAARMANRQVMCL
jgi:hypothetical protein